MALPSTYIGPLFNNNGKSYTDNLLSGEGTGDWEGNLAIDLVTPFAANKAINIGKNLYTKGPKYIFDNLPYKTIYNIEGATSNIKDDIVTFLKTPINESPIKAVRNRRKSLQVGKMPRTDIQYDNNIYYNTHSTSIQDIRDAISQIRRRLHTRMNNKNYVYSYPNDGIGIYLDNNMYNPDYIISQIPVKDYLSLKDVYKMGVDKHS